MRVFRSKSISHCKHRDARLGNTGGYRFLEHVDAPEYHATSVDVEDRFGRSRCATFAEFSDVDGGSVGSGDCMVGSLDRWVIRKAANDGSQSCCNPLPASLDVAGRQCWHRCHGLDDRGHCSCNFRIQREHHLVECSALRCSVSCGVFEII